MRTLREVHEERKQYLLEADLEHFEIVPREEWGALPPTAEEPLQVAEPKFVVVTFTGTRECYSKEDCCRFLRHMQKRDMESGLPDVRFNFLIGGDSSVYEGRGWLTNNHKHDIEWRDFNGKSMDIAYIGPFPQPYQKNYPEISLKLAKDDLIHFGVTKHFIDCEYNRSKGLEGCEDAE